MDDIYKALAHPARRKIIALLRNGALNAGELAEHFDFAKPTLSGHLNILRNAKLIHFERHGTTLIYRANISVIEDALAALMDLFKLGSSVPSSPLECAAAGLPATPSKTRKN